MPRALLSVSNKDGLFEFATELDRRGWTLLSTGGTARALRESGIDVTDISDVTGHPEIMDGRVKTLHPAVHGGLLGRTDVAGDREAMSAHGYEPIDLIAVNLYPFRETVAREGVTRAEAIEQIDIGGPSMLRSGAKNHERVWVVVDPADYSEVLAAMKGDAAAGLEFRGRLATKVFGHTAAYDRAIADYLEGAEEESDADGMPERITLDLERVQPLRYGENPDQRAAFYSDNPGGRDGLPSLRQLHGKELSFNNLLDVDGAIQAVTSLSAVSASACAIVKHTTPCGLAVADSIDGAYEAALATDPMSAFGSVVAFDGLVSSECAALIRENFVEAVVAPGFDPAAIEILSSKKNIRLLEWSGDARRFYLDFKRVNGGFLVQDRMNPDFADTEWKCVTQREPTAAELHDLRFAWRAVASVKSNAILLAKGGATIGIGAGQMSRVDSSRIAVRKARDSGHSAAGAVLASDAFFPFRDGVDAAAEAGVKAIVQPGGSVRDEEVVAAADEHGIAMIFTGRRLFRH